MFLHLSVILFTGGVQQTPRADTLPLGRQPPSPVDDTYPTGMHSCYLFKIALLQGAEGRESHLSPIFFSFLYGFWRKLAKT